VTDAHTRSTEDVQHEWTLGSYSILAHTFLPMAATVVEAGAVEAGDRVLDVACGTGNVSLTAARRGATVTGVDITPAMLEMARERGEAIEIDVDWQAGDATDLPFADDAFDVTLSCLGHAFADDPAAAGAELLRVTRPGGRIAFTSWTPASAVAAMVGAIVEHLPPEPNAPPPPALWGNPDAVRDRIGDGVTDLRFESGIQPYPAVSPAEFWHSMTVDSGPVMVALDAVDETTRERIDEAAVEALEVYFSPADNAVELEYQLVTATVD